MLHLRTFGGLALQRDGTTLDQVNAQRKALSLLAGLAAVGKAGIGRERLMALLWPESDTERARGALKQMLHALRRQLGTPEVIAGTVELRLNPSYIESDVGRFRDALATGHPEAAVSHYHGPFLDGVHLDGAPEFQAWVDRQRAELERGYQEALELAALGRIAEMEETLAELTYLQPIRGLTPGTALREIAEELRAHGNVAASERLLRRAITAHEWLLAEQLASPAVRSGLAAALYRVGRYREAREMFATLAAENPANIEYLGYLGVIAAREGHPREAARIAVQLANLDRPYLFGLNTFWRARIAALLGDQQDAIRLLQAAFAEGRPYSTAWHREPDFESLHSNPAFRRFPRPAA